MLLQGQSQKFANALLGMDRVGAKRVLAEACRTSSAMDAVEATVVPALAWIGDGWETGDIALSQVYMTGRICEDLVDELLPPASPDRKHQPNMAIVVLEDQHVLGKRIVYALMRASGFEVADYGTMLAEALADRADADQIEALFISTLMLPAAHKVGDVVARLQRRGTGTKVFVGGAPFYFGEDLWQAVGADAMGRSASDAIKLAQDLSVGGGV